MLRLYGEQVIPLSKLVKEFCLKQGNMKETAVFQQLVYARWAWKELFRKSIWEIKNQVIEIDCKNNTFHIPSDCERIVNISVIDCNKIIQPLTCDPGISTVEIKCIKPKCSCNKCNGENTLCASIDAVSYTTEEIIIQGNPYTLQTWTRYNNGAIQQEQIIPTLNATTNAVENVTTISTICNVEVTEEGCIKPTTGNMELLRTHCGCGNFPAENCGVDYGWHRYENLIPQPYNYFGYWNVNAADRSIIHIFRHENGHRPRHERDRIEKVIVSYQTNGETTDQEIMIPQYAQFAIDMGIMWQQKLFNPRAGQGDKEFAKNEWRAACRKVNQHLNPIRMEDIAKLQTQLRRW